MKKILLVEDDASLRTILVQKIESAGYELDVAVDGEEVFSVLSRFTPDLILLDLIMPKMDGYAVLEKLHADQKFVQIPVIVTSNLGESSDIKKARELGAIDFFVKSDMPINEILEKIKKYLVG